MNNTEQYTATAHNAAPSKTYVISSNQPTSSLSTPSVASTANHQDATRAVEEPTTSKYTPGMLFVANFQ